MYEYKSQLELYQGLIPALNVKVKYLKRANNKEITKEDVIAAAKGVKLHTVFKLLPNNSAQKEAE